MNVSQTFVKGEDNKDNNKKRGGIEENGIFKIEKQQGICLHIDMKT